MKFSVRTPLLVLLLLASGLSGACAASTQAPSTDASADNEPDVSDVPVYASWDEVTAAAQGTTVNWFVWGGSETINSHVDGVIGAGAARRIRHHPQPGAARQYRRCRQQGTQRKSGRTRTAAAAST